MFNFNGPAILVATTFFLLLLWLSLTFAFQDTVRGFCELFDLRVVRNYFRSVLRYRLRFSLRWLLVAAMVMPPLIAFGFRVESPDWYAAAVIMGYLVIVVCPLVYWFFIEAFGPSPRERWRDFKARHEPQKTGPFGPASEKESSL